VMGAPSDDTATGFNAGSAYVFVRSGTVWSLQQKLVASDAAAFDAFGFSVSASGDTVLVGAFLDDVGAAADAGSAYAFVRAGPVWTQQQKLVASDAGAGDYFGYTVSAEGDAAVVGAVRHDTAAGADAGAAYVFARAGASWTEHSQLTAPDGGAGDELGFAVSLSADTVAVGAPHDDTPGGLDAGSVHVFRGSVPVELQSFSVE
jgi:hypothetical protein